MSPDVPPDLSASRAANFIRQIVEDDLRRGMDSVVTRFPPEPNGYLHIGHAKAICLNFGIAEDYPGRCHLRFDDTNPETEDIEYVHAAIRDIRWLGFDWGEHQYYASDYFEALYDMAERLVLDGKAYVDSLTEEEIREYRGTVTEPGRNSPYRDRSPEENLDLLRRMRAGEFPDGSHVLRARIDMASVNMLLRDPVLYRIKHAEHYRRGNDWCIYPLYDYAHPLSDAIEGITHSLCSLEFEVHRPLYDWLVDALYQEPRPHQYEFARLNLDYMIMSKRKLLRLVNEGYVDGWDDPRMPTLAGMRRRGYTPEAIRRFADLIGVAKADNRIDISLLEFAVRDDLNQRAPRVMTVVRPLKVVLTNWPEDRIEWIDAPYWPHDVPRDGSRPVPFGRNLFIEQDDFAEEPPKGFHRLSPGSEVRLRYGYVIRCDEVVKDDTGSIVELRCSVDLDTRSGETSGRRVKGTIHWVEAGHAVPVEVRLYDRLFRVPDPEDVPEGETFIDRLHPDSREIVTTALAEHSLATATAGDRFQFERQGYFFADPEVFSAENRVFNRTITLRDTWARKADASAGSVDTAASGRKDASASDPGAARSADPARTKPAAVGTSSAVPELTAKERGLAESLAERWGIAFEDAALMTVDAPMRDYFEEAALRTTNPRAVANWLIHEVQRERKERSDGSFPIRPEHLVELVALVDDGTLSSRLAKDVFADVIATGHNPRRIVDDKGLVQMEDVDALSAVAAEVVAAFPDRAEAFRGGKTGLIGFFLGQVMQRTGGRANPQLARQLLESALAK